MAKRGWDNIAVIRLWPGGAHALRDDTAMQLQPLGKQDCGALAVMTRGQNKAMLLGTLRQVVATMWVNLDWVNMVAMQKSRWPNGGGQHCCHEIVAM